MQQQGDNVSRIRISTRQRKAKSTIDTEVKYVYLLFLYRTQKDCSAPDSSTLENTVTR